MLRLNHDAISPSFDPGELIEVDIDTLREEFRALRRRRRMSQADVAGLLEISQATISAFEQGRHHRIRPKTLRGLWDIVALWKRKGGLEGEEWNSNILRRQAADMGTADPCPQCGSRVPTPRGPVPFCPSCGRCISDTEDAYCSGCGAKLNSSYVRATHTGDADVRLGILKKVLCWIERGDSLTQLVHELSQLGLSADEK